MTTFNESDLKNILSKLLIKSFTNSEPAREVIEQAIDDQDFKEQITFLCEAYLKPEYRESRLIAKSVDIRALSNLMDICKRECIGIIPICFSGEDEHIYNKEDKISILVLSGQLNEVNQALLEANAVSGAAVEMPRYSVDGFGRNLKDENPMIEIKGVKKDIYEAMKHNMEKLPYEMQFTLFPEMDETNRVNVGFFLKTQPVVMKRGHKRVTEGPYMIPKLASMLLASAILEKPHLDKKYKEIEKRNREVMQEILDMYYDEEPYYMVPAMIGREGLNVFMDQAYYVDTSGLVDMDSAHAFAKAKFNGLNHIVVPMAAEEFNQYRNEVIVSPDQLDFYKNNPMPVYVDAKEMLDKDIGESLIEMLNRKREQVMLLSDDFNSKNLLNLENYIVGTVHEMIMREDEDFSKWMMENEVANAMEAKLLNELDHSYTMVAVYESHDKISELINNEKSELEGIDRKNPSNEELSI